MQPDVAGRAAAALADHGHRPTPGWSPATATSARRPAAPYDRVIVTVGIAGLSPRWIDQLVPGGIVLAPVRHAGHHPVMRVRYQRPRRGRRRRGWPAAARSPPPGVRRRIHGGQRSARPPATRGRIRSRGGRRPPRRPRSRCPRAGTRRSATRATSTCGSRSGSGTGGPRSARSRRRRRPALTKTASAAPRSPGTARSGPPARTPRRWRPTPSPCSTAGPRRAPRQLPRWRATMALAGDPAQPISYPGLGAGQNRPFSRDLIGRPSGS